MPRIMEGAGPPHRSRFTSEAPDVIDRKGSDLGISAQSAVPWGPRGFLDFGRVGTAESPWAFRPASMSFYIETRTNQNKRVEP